MSLGIGQSHFGLTFGKHPHLNRDFTIMDNHTLIDAAYSLVNKVIKDSHQPQPPSPFRPV